MLQAAACHEVSMAHPLSVFDRRQPECKEKRRKWRRKKTNWMLNKLNSKETGIKGWKAGGGLCITETKLFQKQSMLGACFGTSDGLWARKQKNSTQSPFCMICLCCPLHEDREQDQWRGVCGTEPARDNEEPLETACSGSLFGSENPLGSLAIFCDPRKLQGDTVFMNQNKPACRADGHKGHSSKAALRGALLVTLAPSSTLPSQHTCAGNLPKKSSAEDRWCLLARKGC